jgi:hypothetical protein
MCEPTTLINLFVAIGNQLNSLWGLFITAHIVIIAAIYGIERLRRLSILEICLFSIGYILFSVVNIRAKLESYKLLNAIAKEIELSIKGSNLDILSKYFEGVELDDRIIILWVVHVFTVVAIAIVAVTKKYYSKDSRFTKHSNVNRR